MCKVAAGRGEHIGKHTVSKTHSIEYFLLKYGVKMEVLTAEGHSTGSFPWKGGREGGGSGWRRRGRGRRLSGQRKKGGVKAEQE